LYQALTLQNIFVRYFSDPLKISNFLRISIGDQNQNLALIEALTKIIQN